MQPLILDNKFSVRPISEADKPGLKTLLESFSEPGLVSTVMQFKVSDVNEAFDSIRPGSYGLVAFSLDQPATPIGLIYGWPHQVQLGQRSSDLNPAVDRTNTYQAILIYGLVVHPMYKRQGQAESLTTLLETQLIEWAKQTYTSQDLIIYAYTQKLDERTKSKTTGRSLYLTPVKTKSSTSAAARKVQGGIPIRIEEAVLDDYETIVQGLNFFNQDTKLYSPQSSHSLAEWLAPRKIEGQYIKLARYYVARNDRGEVQSGMGIFETPSLYDVQVIKSPAVVKLVNKFLKIIPADGFLKTLQISRVWYKPGQLELARQLWQFVREQESPHGSSIVISFDPTSLLKPLYNLSPAQLTARLHLVVYYAPSELNFSTGTLASYES